MKHCRVIAVDLWFGAVITACEQGTSPDCGAAPKQSRDKRPGVIACETVAVA